MSLLASGNAAAAKLPATPYLPSPVDGATNVATKQTLSCSSDHATQFDFYLTATSTLPSTPTIANASVCSFVIPLSAGVAYQWRVVAKNRTGATKGPVWRFTAAPTSGLAIACPANQSATSTTNQPVAVDYPPVMTVSGVSPVTVTYAPASGSLFPVGQTTVVAAASSADGQLARCSFLVTVTYITQNPLLTITCPTNQTVTSQTGGPIGVTFTVTASGGVAPILVNASPASGSLFAVGETAVTASASSSDGQTATCMFLVTVTPPLILSSVPNQTASSPDGGPVIVTFPLPTASGGIQPYAAITCTPASGTLFPVGTTTDTCRVSDSESPSVTAMSTFSVTVTAVTGSLTVTWDANAPSDNITNYQIRYGAVSGQYTTTFDSGLNTTATLTGLTTGVTYYFSVAAFNGEWSANSTEVSATP